jgi:triacylglycerol esterase/lipase EstA (alpha/beta hydrolase family)
MASLACVTVLGAGPGGASGSWDPAYSVPVALLRAALQCDRPVHPAREPVLLVHGTFTNGHEEWDWGYRPALRALGFDTCVVTYPDRGLGDIQVSAEYVAFAVRAIHRLTGRKVDMVGHSQGGLMPRWAIKYWPSVRSELDDFVMLAAPNHGTLTAARPTPSVARPESFFQMAPGSNFVRTLNAGDETPGRISYSSLYSLFDELVQPAAPVPTAALDWKHEGPNTRNLAIQRKCPGRLVDHVGIATTDAVAFALVVDALEHRGPVNPARVPNSVCRRASYIRGGLLGGLLSAWRFSMSKGLPRWHFAWREPILRPYARHP